ncbi:hypothetical protein RZS08_00680, partial [Arthrospira platensis SPKY1]|nr:hypothetical protein [Arthrospira platensis SPKY1]
MAVHAADLVGVGAAADRARGHGVTLGADGVAGQVGQVLGLVPRAGDVGVAVLAGDFRVRGRVELHVLVAHR